MTEAEVLAALSRYYGVEKDGPYTCYDDIKKAIHAAQELAEAKVHAAQELAEAKARASKRLLLVAAKHRQRAWRYDPRFRSL